MMSSLYLSDTAGNSFYYAAEMVVMRAVIDLAKLPQFFGGQPRNHRSPPPYFRQPAPDPSTNFRPWANGRNRYRDSPLRGVPC